MAIHLRSATPEDAYAVARIHVRSWQVAYRGFFPDAYLDGLRPEARAARYTFGEAGPEKPATLVAVDNQTLCGFATTGPADSSDVPEAGELLALHVDPDWWRRGVGRALIAAARERLARRGYTEAVVWMLEGNERAELFYTADGWRPDGHRRLQEVWGVSASELRYHRLLATDPSPR